MYQTNTLYTLNLHNILYQLYLNKSEKEQYRKETGQHPWQWDVLFFMTPARVEIGQGLFSRVGL